MSGINYLGDGNPDGTVMGQTDSKLGFYGLLTPVAIQTVAATTTTTATTTALQADIDAIRTALQAVNIIT